MSRFTRVAATVALVVFSVSGGLLAAERPALAAAPTCPQTNIVEAGRTLTPTAPQYTAGGDFFPFKLQCSWSIGGRLGTLTAVTVEWVESASSTLLPPQYGQLHACSGLPTQLTTIIGFQSEQTFSAGRRVSVSATEQSLLSPQTRAIAASLLAAADSVAAPCPGPTPAPTAAQGAVRIDHIEVVQAVQTAKNEVPLVSGKKAAVRVFVGATGNSAVAGVKGRLTVAVANGAPITLTPSNAGGAMTAPTAIDRAVASHSLNFLLPDAVVAGGTVRLTAEITPPADGATPIRGAPLDVTFARPPKWPDVWAVSFMRICTQIPPTPKRVPGQPPPVAPKDAQVICPSVEADLAELDTFLTAWFPVGDNGIFYYALPTGELVWRRPLDTYEDAQYLLAVIRRIYDVVSVNPTVGDQLVAWLPIYADTGNIGGISDPVWLEDPLTQDHPGHGHVTWVKDTTDSDIPGSMARLAHELGHNLGLHHPGTDDACNARDANTDWKAKDATIGEIGFDPLKMAVVPKSRFDLMSYCPALQRWISPFHFQQLYDADARRPGAVAERALAAAAGAPLAVPTDYLVVTGTARRDGSSGSLDPAARVTDTTTPEPSDPKGNHCLRLTGGATTPVYCLNLLFVRHDTGQSIQEESFTVKVPFASGTTRVELLRGTRSLASLASGSPPRIAFTTPSPDATIAGRTKVEWTATGGDAATYTVLYSFDGRKTWLPIAIDTTDTSVIVDAGKLAAGDVHIRVIASSGIENTVAELGPLHDPGGRTKGFPGAAGVAGAGSTGPNAALGYGVLAALAALIGWAVVAGRRRGQRPTPVTAASPPASASPAPAPVARRFCGECGRPLRLQAKFCGGCGTRTDT